MSVHYEQRANGTTWPVDVETDDEDSVEWKLRYNPNSLTRADQLGAAAILAAYNHLRRSPLAYKASTTTNEASTT